MHSHENKQLFKVEKVLKKAKAFASVIENCAEAPSLLETLLKSSEQEILSQKPKPVGQWHSILEEIPEEFRNVPKAKKGS